jgi:hypothetical protein
MSIQLFSRTKHYALASLLLAGLASTAACSSDSGGDSSTNGGSAGTSSNTGGSSAGTKNEGGSTAGTKNEGGSTAGTKTEGGGDSGGNSSSGGSGGGLPVAGSAGTSAAGSSGTSYWACIEAGGACICQNNSDAAHESVCMQTYMCCGTIPVGSATRCQCQNDATFCKDNPDYNIKHVASCPPP